MRKILILGATGSIGGTCIKAIKEHNLPFRVEGVVAYNSPELEKIANDFNCDYLYTKGKTDEDLYNFLKDHPVDIVLNGIAGSPGLIASIYVLQLHYDLALANKETVVLGGEFIFKMAEENGATIYPVDSEHSCIWNLLKAHKKENVEQLIITASGGPFYNRPDTSNVTVEEALHHPTWKMGPKITIDSATLANKGLEVIEAGYLFGYDADHIKVTVHRQSVVHSMVKLNNGAYYAQMTPPDMTLPIIGALAEGHIPLHDIVKPLDFTNLTLTFGPWSEEQFPILGAAYKALHHKHGYPIALLMADEVAVHAFLDKKIAYDDIAKIVLRTLDADWSMEITDYDVCCDVMKKATEVAEQVLASC